MGGEKQTYSQGYKGFDHRIEDALPVSGRNTEFGERSIRNSSPAPRRQPGLGLELIELKQYQRPRHSRRCPTAEPICAPFRARLPHTHPDPSAWLSTRERRRQASEPFPLRSRTK